MPHPYFDHPARPSVIAHRGLVSAALAKRHIVENSYAAFATALAAGADYIESDCHLTSDGAVVMFHDADLARVTGDPRKVSEVTRRELAEIMRDRGGLLTLEEAFEEFPHARFNIDVKAAAAADAVGVAVAPHARRALVTSFSDEYRLRALRSAAAVPGTERPATSAGRGLLVRLLAAVRVGARRRAAKLLSTVDALQIPEKHGVATVFCAPLISAAHAAGVEVHVWTVNDADDMRSLVARGADGIVTDRADLALAVLR